MMGFFGFFLLINFATGFLMLYDKEQARSRRRRLPETTLLLPAFLGGGFGAVLGALLFHHKTRKWKFRLLLPLSLVTSTLLYCSLYHRLYF